MFSWTLLHVRFAIMYTRLHLQGRVARRLLWWKQTSKAKSATLLKTCSILSMSRADPFLITFFVFDHLNEAKSRKNPGILYLTTLRKTKPVQNWFNFVRCPHLTHFLSHFLYLTTFQNVQNGIQIERYERTDGRTNARTDAHQFFGTPTQKPCGQ